MFSDLQGKWISAIQTLPLEVVQKQPDTVCKQVEVQTISSYFACTIGRRLDLAHVFSSVCPRTKSIMCEEEKYHSGLWSKLQELLLVIHQLVQVSSFLWNPSECSRGSFYWFLPAKTFKSVTVAGVIWSVSLGLCCQFLWLWITEKSP